MANMMSQNKNKKKNEIIKKGTNSGMENDKVEHIFFSVSRVNIRVSSHIFFSQINSGNLVS